MHPEMSGSRSVEEEPMLCSITSREPIRFDWQNRWLKGHEYAFMLQNVESYCRRFGIGKYPAKIHPKEIYEQPRNGMLYFVEGKGLGSEFGFPRVQGKKKFRWKKMNFTTDLPKKNPQVTYIVASTTHTHTPQIDDNQQQLFRMHAVIPHERQNYGPQNSFILCHILEIKRNRELEGVKNCCKFNNIDFYKLFSFLHNSVLQIK